MIRKILFLAALLAVVIPASAQRMHRNELSLSYGAFPTTNWVDEYVGYFDGFYGNASSTMSAWGAVTAGYSFSITKRLSVGVQGVYSSNEQRYHTLDATVHNRYWAVMPAVKFSWANLRMVSFYSRVGMGLSFAKSKTGGESVSETQVAFQVSALGVETNGRLGVYAEAGVGQSGCILIGGRWRF